MLVHRRAILETNIIEQRDEVGETYLRYTATWDDAIMDTWEGYVPLIGAGVDRWVEQGQLVIRVLRDGVVCDERIPILRKRHIKQERLKKDEVTG